MKRNKLILPSLIALLAMGGMATAQDTGGYDDAPRVQRQRQGPQGQLKQGRAAKAGQRMNQKLGLDASQQALFEQGQAQMKKKGKKLRKKLKALTQAREEAMSNGDFDTLHELIDKQAALKSKRAHARLNAMEPFTESLSPQQRQQLQKMLKKRHQARGARRGPPSRRGGRRGPGKDSPKWED